MTTLRITTLKHDDVECEYNDYRIHVWMDRDHDVNSPMFCVWYIQVHPVEDSMLYDGWWDDSSGRSWQEAIAEACNGAVLDFAPQLLEELQAERTRRDKVTPKMAQLAAAWWAKVLSNPRFNNGDDSEIGTRASLLAHTVARPLTEQQLLLFKEELTRKILEENLRGIFTDYHPDVPLGDAMEAAGIPSANAPWKTGMHLNADSVEVSYGYRAEYTPIDPQEFGL
jgi:hypothetical protein